MKRVYITLTVLFISITLFSQGIAVQGIARDADKSAITNENLNFDFRILDSENQVQYRETQQIRTDNFGLFSHVLSSGTAADNTIFNNVDFSKKGLKLVVWINYNSTNVEVYNQELQYVPYAHFAKKSESSEIASNGVPPGTIVAFIGNDSKIPEGWVKCTGQDISSGKQYEALRAIVGSKLPDLRGRFLKGDGRGTVPEGQIDDSTPIGDTQDQTVLLHNHYIRFWSKFNGEHAHRITHLPQDRKGNVFMGSLVGSPGTNDGWAYFEGSPREATSREGNHDHLIEGSTHNNGSNENKPWTVIVNYIIKL
ncbi:phage tail protein [Polaribacter tangerinus]|uniref:phage tail protein n=1 Tax=Polaribacter tangerinus TaxID=1920034 RepID=UPI000B4B73BD|nr:tail fiber protein [Polaribacter tangerinus]